MVSYFQNLLFTFFFLEAAVLLSLPVFEGGALDFEVLAGLDVTLVSLRWKNNICK